MLSLLQTFQRPNLQLWNKAYHISKLTKEKDRRIEEILPPKRGMSAKRLAEISLIVDTGGAYQEGIEEIARGK